MNLYRILVSLMIMAPFAPQALAMEAMDSTPSATPSLLQLAAQQMMLKERACLFASLDRMPVDCHEKLTDALQKLIRKSDNKASTAYFNHIIDYLEYKTETSDSLAVKKLKTDIGNTLITSFNQYEFSHPHKTLATIVETIHEQNLPVSLASAPAIMDDLHRYYLKNNEPEKIASLKKHGLKLDETIAHDYKREEKRKNEKSIIRPQDPNAPARKRLNF